MKNTFSFKNFAEVLYDKAKSCPDRLAFEFLNDDKSLDTLTYRELHQQAQAIAVEMRKIGKKGDRVLLMYPPSMDFVIAFWACIYSGMIAVPAVLPVKKTSFSQRIQHIIDCCNPILCLTNSTTAKLLTLNKLNRPISKIPLLKLLAKKISHLNPLDSHFFLDRIPLLLTDKVKYQVKNSESSDISQYELNDIVLLQFTSGSTSIPKGVIITHENLLANTFTISDARLNQDTRTLLWLPPYHDMGLILGLLNPVHIGYPSRLMSTQSFIKDPLLWLEQVAEFKATATAGPNFAFDLCTRYYDEERMRDVDLSHLTIALCGAETIHYSTLKLFEDRYAKHGFQKRTFLPAYGLAESTLFVTGIMHYDIESALKIDAADFKNNIITLVDDEIPHVRLMSCGTNYSSQILKIADPDGRELPDDVIGKIVVKSKSVAMGYWNSPEDSKRYFSFRIKNDEQHYLDTGDMGFVHENHLYVTGREKEIIIIHGKNYYPQWIEKSIQDVSPAIRKNCTIAFQSNEISSDRIIIALEIYPDKINNEQVFQNIARCIQNKIREDHDLHIEKILFFEKYALGKTTSGKIPRALIAKKYHNNELTPLYAWTNAITTLNTQFAKENYFSMDEKEQHHYLQQRVIQLIAEQIQLKVDHIKPDELVTEYIGESLSQLEFLSKLGMIFSISIPPALLASSPSINHFTVSLDERIKAVNLPVQHTAALATLPLLPMQQFVLDYVGFVEFNLARVLTIAKPITHAVLTQALQSILFSQPYLRSLLDKSINRWITQDASDLHKLFFVDEIYLPEQEQASLKTQLKNIIKSHSMRIDICKGPLLFLTLVNLPNNTQKLVLVVSHYIVDPFSVGLLVRSLENIIFENQSLEKLIWPYVRDEINILNDFLQPKIVENDFSCDYWKNRHEAKTILAAETWCLQNVDNYNHNQCIENIEFDQSATMKLHHLSRQHDLDDDSLLLGVFLRSFNELSQQDNYLIQLQSHGRYLSEHLQPITNTITWMNISWPVMLRVSKERSLLDDIQSIYHEIASTRKNSHAYNVGYYHAKALKDNLIPPEWPTIEFSNLGKLNNKNIDVRYFKDSPLFSKDYLHGETFEPSMKRYRQIFVRPYWRNDLLYMPIFYNRNLFSDNQILLLKEKIHSNVANLASS